MLGRMTTPSSPSHAADLADAVVAAVQPLHEAAGSAWPDSRVEQMTAALLIGASHVRAEVLRAQSGDVRCPKLSGFSDSIEKLAE